MGGLKQKAKTKGITHGKISIICANCNLDRTKEQNPLSTQCPRCGFKPSFPNIIAERLIHAEEEISYYKKMANKYTKETYLLKEEIAKLKNLLKNYNDQALAYEKSVEEKLGQIREHTKELIQILALPNMGDEGRKQKLVAIKAWQIKHNELVGLLGQNSETKKEEKC